MDNNNMNMGDNNEIKQLNENDLESVAGGYTSIVDWPSWRKKHCDNCKKVIGEDLKGLQSPDGDHHLCENCINDIKRMMPNGYETYIENVYHIKLNYSNNKNDNKTKR